MNQQPNQQTNTQPNQPTDSAPYLPDDKRSIQRLVFAVIVDAAMAARKGNSDAAQWIQEEGVIWMDGAFDVFIPPERVSDWIKRGCPLPRDMMHKQASASPKPRRKSRQRPQEAPGWTLQTTNG